MGISRTAIVVGLMLIECVVNGLATSRNQHFVVSESRTSKNILSRDKRQTTASSIASLHVTSVVVSRFARVEFASKMENDKDEATEKVFSVRLPSAAFITEFNMIVNGVTFVGKVKEKEEAEEQYQQAVESGNVAGLVKADVRETETFDVSAHVPAHSSVDFHLVYQQLLNRRLGQYDHVIMVNPGELIDDFVIEVYITETSGIESLSVEFPGGEPGPRNKASPDSEQRVEINTDIRRSKYQAKVSFKPTATEQRRFLMLPPDLQKFTVTYDVKREVLGGDIQTRNGYFVHFFAPEDLPILPKRVVFVIDRSGSMDGRKMEQAKSALVSIIKELRKTDRFNVVTFSSDVTEWRTAESGVVTVSKKTVREAIEIVQQTDAGGATNLNGAILRAAEMLNNSSAEDRESSMIILLTDGEPTAGVTDTSQIRLNAKRKISGQYSLFCLGFGDNVNHDFLNRLANENDGIARKIYEDSDAELQLKGFFQEVASPLLLHVKMTYTGANLTDLSQTKFDNFFKGSETIVVGSYNSDQPNAKIESVIKGKSGEDDVEYKITSREIDSTFKHWFKDSGEFEDFIERLWAYFTIRDLLEKRILTENRVERQKLTDRVLHLALKYNFVTSLTSMVVTLPEDEITTTTTGPTILPPIPPCFLRGSAIPDYIIRPPIWCPIILDPTWVRRNNPSRPSSRPSRGYAGLSGISSGGRSLSKPGRSASTSNSAFRRAPQRVMGYPSSGRYLHPQLDIAYTTASPATKMWKKCSGTLTKSSGTIQFPDESGPLPVFMCRWKISLPRGSWIDLFVEAAKTSRNEVVVKSERKTVYEHTGGVSPAEYISLEHNSAVITFTIYEDDIIRPGIEISYREFSANEGLGSTPAALPEMNTLKPNCGKNISSSQNMAGKITSPGYPQTYHDETYCLWNLVNEATETHVLKLTFKDMDIESSINHICPNDKLIVKYGSQEDVICGQQIPDNIVTTEKITNIEFLSDDALGANGFALNYKFVQKD